MTRLATGWSSTSTKSEAPLAAASAARNFAVSSAGEWREYREPSLRRCWRTSLWRHELPRYLRARGCSKVAWRAALKAGRRHHWPSITSVHSPSIVAGGFRSRRGEAMGEAAGIPMARSQSWDRHETSADAETMLSTQLPILPRRCWCFRC